MKTFIRFQFLQLVFLAASIVCAEPKAHQELTLSEGNKIQVESDVQAVNASDEDYAAYQQLSASRGVAAAAPATFDRRIFKVYAVAPGDGTRRVVDTSMRLLDKGAEFAVGQEFEITAAWQDATRILLVTQQSPSRFAAVYEKQADGSWLQKDRKKIPPGEAKTFEISGTTDLVISSVSFKGVITPVLHLTETALSKP
jgi:hypothetical protein